MREARGTLKREGQELRFIKAVLRVQRIERVRERFPLRFVPDEHLADEKRSVHRVLVAYKAAAEISIALLKAENVPAGFPGLFEKPDLFADVFEPGQNVSQLHAVMRGDLLRHRRRHNGFDRDRPLRHRAVCLAHPADEVEQQHAHLVARDEPVALRGFHRRADTVAVRVRSEQQLAACILRQTQSDGERFADLRVRVGARWKISVRLRLLRRDSDVRKTVRAKAARHAGNACAVERRVDDGGAARKALRQKRCRRYRGEIPLHGVLADIGNDAGSKPFGKIESMDIREGINTVDLLLNGCGGLRRDLAAVRTVDLVAVVFGAVVACRDDNAAARAKIAHRERKRGCRHQAGINVHANAVRGKNSCRSLGKETGVDAAVISYGDGRRGKMRLEIIGIALRGLADGENIHAVCAGADHAAQSAGTEFQLAVKAVLDGGVVAADGFQLFAERRVSGGFFPPQAVQRVYIHRNILPNSFL